MAMTGFICHDDYLNKTAKLTDEEVGRLFRACMMYHATGELQTLEGRESVAFDFIKEDIDRADQKYADKCEQNRKNRLMKEEIVNGRRPSSTTDDERQQPSTKKEPKIDLAPLFEKFWNAYPRHEAKQVAVKAFEKLKPDEGMLNKMLQAVERQKKTEQWQDKKYIPHPATWLNQRRWEDEVTETTVKAVAAQNYDQRDYTAVQDSVLKRQAARLAARKDASNFAQRDYSDVPGQIMTGIAEELKDFQKGAG